MIRIKLLFRNVILFSNNQRLSKTFSRNKALNNTSKTPLLIEKIGLSQIILSYKLISLDNKKRKNSPLREIILTSNNKKNNVQDRRTTTSVNKANKFTQNQKTPKIQLSKKLTNMANMAEFRISGKIGINSNPITETVGTSPDLIL